MLQFAEPRFALVQFNLVIKTSLPHPLKLLPIFNRVADDFGKAAEERAIVRIEAARLHAVDLEYAPNFMVHRDADIDHRSNAVFAQQVRVIEIRAVRQVVDEGRCGGAIGEARQRTPMTRQRPLPHNAGLPPNSRDDQEIIGFRSVAHLRALNASAFCGALAGAFQ